MEKEKNSLKNKQGQKNKILKQTSEHLLLYYHNSEKTLKYSNTEFFQDTRQKPYIKFFN